MEDSSSSNGKSYIFIRRVLIDGIDGGKQYFLYRSLDEVSGDYMTGGNTKPRYYVSPKSPMQCVSGLDPNIVFDIPEKYEITPKCVLNRKMLCGCLGVIYLWNKKTGWIHDLSEIL